MRSRAFCVVGFVALLTFLVLWSGHLLGISYYAAGNTYQQAQTEKGEIECSEMDLKKVGGSINLAGEWKFYYNKWIITEPEGAEATPDGLIYVPSRWTGKTVGGQTLPRSGTASYSLLMKNVQAGQTLEIHVSVSDVAYRIFANGTLITTYGVMSKNVSEARIAYSYIEQEKYTTTKAEDVFVVIEIGNSGSGGLNDAPVISMMNDEGRAARYYFTNNLPLFFAGIALSFTVINLIMVFSLFGKRKEWTTVTFLVAVFMHYLFSKSLFFVILRAFGAVPPVVFYLLNIFSGCLMVTALFRHLQHEKITDFSQKQQVVLSVFIVAFYIAFFFMTGSFWQCVPFVLILAAMSVVLYRAFRAIQNGVRLALTYSTFWVLCMVVFIYEGLDFWSSIVFGSQEVVTFLVIAVMLVMSVIYFVRMRQNTVEAMKAAQLEKAYTQMRHNTMLAQIKPHFVFNSLTSIQSMYHESVDEGDTALTNFSKHLRANIESDTRELIPFEDELVNINNYFELENLRLKDKVTLFFDIEYFDFEVPILSLQPLVENAIKYAKTETKENGFIQIVSREEAERIVVMVKDNGVGFDTSDIDPNSKGLANITERFNYSLNAEIEIASEVGEGTTVSIFIPKREGDMDELIVNN